MKTRYSVEWMTDVPERDGECAYDFATWSAKGFKHIENARVFAQIEARRNKWGQVWIKTEHAARIDAPEWQWECDHDATEIVEGAK